MSFLHEPPVDRLGGRSDELDAVLRDFFRSEMPNPWPDLAPPETTPVLPLTRPARSWNPVRSRVALAASLGLLLTGTLLLPFTVTPTDRPAESGPVIGDIRYERPSKVRTPDGEEFEIKESLRQGKNGTEFKLEFNRR